MEEKLNERIKVTTTMVDGGFNEYGHKIIMENQLIIMKALKELLEEKNKPRSGKA